MTELMDSFLSAFGNIEVFMHMSWLDLIMRVLCATVIGFLLGLERELSNHPAGMKTHMLVCLGSALTSMIALEMAFHTELMPQDTRVDLSRIASGVVSGMGFIGAGAIMKSRDGTMVTGITTAATLWVSACLGLSIGMGYYPMMLVTFIAVLSATLILKRMEKRFFIKKRSRSVEIILVNKEETLPFLDDYFDNKKVAVLTFEYKKEIDHRTSVGEQVYHCRYTLRVPHGMVFVNLLRDLAMIDNIIEVYETLHGKEQSLDFRKSEEEKNDDD